MTTTPLAVDAELVVVNYLRRTGSRVRDLVGDRVYTVLPAEATFPLLRVVRIGGTTVGASRRLDGATMQLDAYGGSKADARRLIDTALAELADASTASHTAAVVAGVTFGEKAYRPDTGQTPTRPRYVADVTVRTHPA